MDFGKPIVFLSIANILLLWEVVGIHAVPARRYFYLYHDAELHAVKAPVMAACCLYLSRLKTGVIESQSLLLSSLYLKTQLREPDQ